MSGLLDEVRVFYQDAAPEFVVMERSISSGYVYYMNNGEMLIRDQKEGHILSEIEMAQSTIEYLRTQFEEDERIHQQTQLDCEKVRQLHKRTICK